MLCWVQVQPEINFQRALPGLSLSRHLRSVPDHSVPCGLELIGHEVVVWPTNRNFVVVAVTCDSISKTTPPRLEQDKTIESSLSSSHHHREHLATPSSHSQHLPRHPPFP
jgi:hypothetical protein